MQRSILLIKFVCIVASSKLPSNKINASGNMHSCTKFIYYGYSD